MAKKKRPPGWEKHLEKKRLEKYGPLTAPGFVTFEGEEARSNLAALLERMEKNPENFGGWGYFDAEGNEYEDLSFLEEARKKS